MFDFTDKVVLITGAAGNLGKATAVSFYQAGATLVLTHRKLAPLQEAYGDWVAEGRAVLLVADALNADSVQAMVADAIAQFGRIDVLCHAVGGFNMGPPVHETPVEMMQQLFDLNARSLLLMVQAVVPHMLEQEQGKIVAVGARAALQGSAKVGAYSVSKTAVVRLIETMGAELKHQGINVNCVLPSTIDTPQNREAMPKVDPDKWVTPEALADVVLFLASDAARAIHGTAIPVYGLT